jgi:hypothetical protein
MLLKTQGTLHFALINSPMANRIKVAADGRPHIHTKINSGNNDVDNRATTEYL